MTEGRSMRFIAALTGAIAALAVAAQAQETTPPPAADVPPSSCGALVTAPEPPAADAVTPSQLREGVAAFEAWRAAAQPVLDCRRAEVDALNRQSEARVGEYRAAQEVNVARAAAWQALVTEAQARRR